jgi:hypothetical protein
METHGSISPAEAEAALASVERSRARVAWAGYPAWYWLGTGAGLAGLSAVTLLPTWLDLVGVALIGSLLFTLIVRAGRVRGVCEGWTRSAMRRQEMLVLYGPMVLVLIAGAVMSHVVWWAPIAAAALVFTLFAGAGLALSARAARR